MGPDTTTTAIGPGVGAFLAFFALAVALYLLMRNMNARMRWMAYRERDRLAALEAQQPEGHHGERGTQPGERVAKSADEPRDAEPS